MGWVVEGTGKRIKPRRRGRKKVKEEGRTERKEDAGRYAIIQVTFFIYAFVSFVLS